MLLRLTAISSSAVAFFGVVLGGAAVAGVVIAPEVRADAAPLTPLVDAAAQRLQVAEPVAAAKWHSHGAIEDPARVAHELSELRAQAVTQHIDADYVARVFDDQIHATEAIEYSRFADWKFDPAAEPSQTPDLSTARSVIDGLNRDMLIQIAADWDLLHSPDCAAQLDAARTDVTRSRRLDGLYQRALLSATQAYCP